MLKSIIILTAAAALAPLAASAQQTRVLTADKANDYSLVYSLPTTVLDIEIEARQEVRKAGPFWQYAKKYIGTDKAVQKDSESWTVTRVRVTPRGVADPEARFAMQLKPGALTEICVAQDGMILGINRSVDLHSAEPWKSGELSASTLTGNEYLQYVDEDFIASQSTAKRAQMLAQSLMEVRESKVALSRGTAETMPADGRQLELMLQSLQHQEQAMTEAFTGSVQTRTVVTRLTYTPDKEGRSVLCRLSDFGGFTTPDDLAGDPLYIDVKCTARGELPSDDKGETRPFPRDGVAYRIPGTAHITLSYLGRGLFDSDIDLAQYGVTFALDPRLFTDKKAPYEASFDPVTGAVVTLEQQRRE